VENEQAQEKSPSRASLDEGGGEGATELVVFVLRPPFGGHPPFFTYLTLHLHKSSSKRTL